MTQVKIYTASPSDMSPPVDDKSFCVDFVLASDYQALREQMAAEWIEGSEPKEFGRYWVRYNTDVGPRYCSAQWMRYNFSAGSDTNIHNIWLADHSRSINPMRGVTHYTKLPDPLELSQQLREEVKP